MGRLIINYIGFVAFFMGIMAAFRYFTGSIEEWDWMRTLIIAALVGGYSVWRNNKRTIQNNKDD